MDTEIKMILINGSDGTSESVAGEKIESGIFRLMENPILNCKINYGTVVKVIEDKNGDLVLSKIVRASNYKTRQFILSSSLNESDLRTKIGQPILDAGGYWEVVMGGIAFIHILKDSSFSIDELFKINNYHPSEIVDDSNNGV